MLWDKNLWLSLFLLGLLAGCQSVNDTSCPSCAIEPLPVVSATTLDALSDQDILLNYPLGFSTDKARASQQLKDRLAGLEQKGLKITSISSSTKALQTLTKEVIQKGNPPGYFALVGGADGRGFQYYVNNELLQYGFRSLPDTTLAELSVMTPNQLSHIYKMSHYWNNIGYNDADKAPTELKQWIQQQSTRILPHIHTMANVNDLTLNDPQKRQLSQLMILEYLSEAVRGLYYSRQHASLSFYRQLAIKTLKKQESTL